MERFPKNPTERESVDENERESGVPSREEVIAALQEVEYNPEAMMMVRAWVEMSEQSRDAGDVSEVTNTINWITLLQEAGLHDRAHEAAQDILDEFGERAPHAAGLHVIKNTEVDELYLFCRSVLVFTQ
jgi:hypothetical protein